jgi:hypothetical protein
MRAAITLFLLTVAGCGAVQHPDDDLDAAPPTETSPDAASPADGGPPPPPPPPPTLTGVAIQGEWGTQVRQGAGAISLRVKGTNLEGATARIGDLPLAHVSSDELEAQFTWTVEHGAPIGDRTLVVETQGGSASIAGALSVTAITVQSGLVGGNGTTAKPFGFVPDAIAVASDGDDVQLKGMFVHLDVITIPVGVRILGEPGVKVTRPGGGTEGAFVLSGRAQLVGVEIDALPAANADTCLQIAGPDASISDVDVRGCLRGLVVAPAASVTLTNVHLTEQGQSGIVHSGTRLDGTGVTVNRNGFMSTGFRINAGSVSLTDSTLSRAAGVWFGDTDLVWVVGPSAITFKNVIVGVTQLAPGTYSMTNGDFVFAAGTSLTALP